MNQWQRWEGHIALLLSAPTLTQHPLAHIAPTNGTITKGWPVICPGTQTGRVQLHLISASPKTNGESSCQITTFLAPWQAASFSSDLLLGGLVAQVLHNEYRRRV